MDKTNPTTRFSDRVEYYIKYRPKYPTEILDFLKKELNLSIRHIIADIGSGTVVLERMRDRPARVVAVNQYGCVQFLVTAEYQCLGGPSK